MVDSWYCLDRVVLEGMSQVSRRSEVGNHKRRSLNTRLSSGTSATSAGTFACPRALQKMLRRGRYEKRTEHIFCTRSEEWSENRSSRFEPKIVLISFSRGSGPPLRVDLNPRISKICASWISVWNISANYVLVPLKFNLNWNIWKPSSSLEVFTFWFQRAKAWEHEFGRVPSISFIFTGSKMARICKSIYYKYFEWLQCQISSIDRGSHWLHCVLGSLPIGTSVIRHNC